MYNRTKEKRRGQKAKAEAAAEQAKNQRESEELDVQMEEEADERAFEYIKETPNSDGDEADNSNYCDYDVDYNLFFNQRPNLANTHHANSSTEGY